MPNGGHRKASFLYHIVLQNKRIIRMRNWGIPCREVGGYLTEALKLSEKTRVDLGCIVTLSVDICTAASHYTFKKLFLIGITIVIHMNTLNVFFFYMDVALFILKWPCGGVSFTPWTGKFLLQAEKRQQRFWCRLIIFRPYRSAPWY